MAAFDFATLASDNDMLFWIVGGAVAIVAIGASAIKGVLSTRARERTKREIAAYVAEGTIDPDKAIAMLKAGEDADSCA